MNQPTDAPNLAALRLHVLNYREMAPVLIEMGRVEAGVKRAKYLSLVEAGFTEAQALELCK